MALNNSISFLTRFIGDSLPEASADYSPRRAKFAALAQNISSWENDLSSPSKKYVIHFISNFNDMQIMSCFAFSRRSTR